MILDNGLYLLMGMVLLGDVIPADSQSVTFQPPAPTFTEGQKDASFNCSVSGVLQLKVYKNSIEISSTSGKLELHKTSSAAGTTIQLTIRQVTPGDKGNFTCKAFDASSKEAASNQVSVIVYEKPVFTLHPKHLTVSRNTAVVLKCSLNNANKLNPSQDKTIEWCQNNKPISGKVIGGVSTLEVTKIDKNSTYGCGIRGYECQEKATILLRMSTTASTTSSTTPPSTASSTTPASSTSTPTAIAGSVSFSNKHIYHEDKSVFVCCTFRTSTPSSLQVSWYRDGYRLEHVVSRVTMSLNKLNSTVYEGLLQFDMIYHRDKGNYSCRATDPTNLTREVKFPLLVFYRPMVQLSTITPFVPDGSSVNLTCYVSNMDEIEPGSFSDFTWCANGKYLSRSSTHFETPGPGRETLYIDKVSSEATYSCSVDGTCSTKATIIPLEQGSSVCTDSVDKKHIPWKKTVAGATMVQACPVAYYGKLSRVCNSAAEWEDGNDFSCVDQTLIVLSDRIENIKEGLESVDVILPVLLRFRLLISDPNRSLTSGDVNFAVDLLNEIASVINNSGYKVNDTATSSFLEIIDVILSKDKEPDWNLIHKETNTTKAADLMSVLKVFGLSKASQLSDEVETVQKQNFVFQVRKTQPEKIEFPPPNTPNASATLKLNASTLANLKEGGGPLLVILGFFKTMSAFLSSKTDPSISASDETGRPISFIINSPIISLSVYVNVGAGYQPVNNLTPGVQITTDHYPTLNPSCEMHAPENRTWLKRSSVLKSGNSTLTVCEYGCTGDYAVTSDESKIPEIVIIAVQVFTGFMLLITLVMAIKNFILNREGSPQKVLKGITYVSMVVGYTLFIFGGKATSNLVVCANIGISIHTFFLLTAFLSLSMSLLEYNCLSNTVDRDVIRCAILITFSCVLAVAIVGWYIAVNGTDGYGSNKVCIPTETNGALYLLVIPLLLTAMVHVGLCVHQKYRGTNSANRKLVKPIAKTVEQGLNVGRGLFLALLSVYSEIWAEVLVCVLSCVQSACFVVSEREETTDQVHPSGSQTDTRMKDILQATAETAVFPASTHTPRNSNGIAREADMKRMA